MFARSSSSSNGRDWAFVPNRIALAAFREERLPLPGDIVRDDARRRVEDVLGGAVVLLELDDFSSRKIILKIEDVIDVRSTKTINTLIFVAHRGDVAGLPGQQLHQDVLRLVRVLVLVDEQVLKALV